MSTQIQTLCAEALTRIGINPTQATREKLDDFVRAIDARSAHLDALDRLELENAVVEYTVAWATADLLENSCGIQGPLTKTGRANPALAQAATARNRMRHILKTIKTLLKSHSTQGEGETPAEPPSNRTTVQTAPPAKAEPPKGEGDAPAEPPHTTPATSTAPQAHAETAHPTQGEGEAPAEPPRENATTQPQTQAKPLQANTEPEPAAPPMNRTQRRAQARLEAKLHRKAQKRLRRQKQSANESTSAPDARSTASIESTPSTHAVVGNHSGLKS